LIPELDQLLVSAVRYGFSTDELIELVGERAEQFRWNRASASTSGS
jgi:hypothetical protein